MNGKHWILNIKSCEPRILNSHEILLQILRDAAHTAGLETITHEFKPQGFTAILLLSTSHISIHSFPENNAAAIDLYSCDPNTNGDKAIARIRDEMRVKEYTLQVIDRNLS